MERAVCPVWKTEATMETKRLVVTIDSPRTAGAFQIPTMLLHTLRSLSLTNRQRARLTTRIIDLRAKVPVTSDSESAMPPCALGSDDIDVNRLLALNVPERADRLLAFYALMSGFLGMTIDVRRLPPKELDIHVDCELAYSESLVYQEVVFLRDHLCSKGWLHEFQDDKTHTVTVSVEGFERMRERALQEEFSLFSRVEWFLAQ